MQVRRSGGRTGARGPRLRPTVGWPSLSPAERTVANLVGEGRSNGEIASALCVSKRTVETHISRIYDKLQVTSRVAIANVVRGHANPISA